MNRTVEVLVEDLSTRQLKVLMGYGIKVDSPDDKVWQGYKP